MYKQIYFTLLLSFVLIKTNAQNETPDFIRQSINKYDSVRFGIDNDKDLQTKRLSGATQFLGVFMGKMSYKRKFNETKLVKVDLLFAEKDKVSLSAYLYMNNIAVIIVGNSIFYYINGKCFTEIVADCSCENVLEIIKELKQIINNTIIFLSQNINLSAY